MKTWEAEAECRSCKGTGLYSGMAELDGAAVVCRTCKGAGCESIQVTYTPFGGRKRTDVVRVWRVNPGFGLCPEKSPGGVPCEEWERDPESVNAPGTETRDYVCPAWWYQSADYKKKPDWEGCGWGAFRNCEHFPNKSKCWERWDRENPS